MVTELLLMNEVKEIMKDERTILLYMTRHYYSTGPRPVLIAHSVEHRINLLRAVQI